MNALEFSKIQPQWLEIENELKQKCLDNNISYYDYLGSFVRFDLFNYRKQVSLIETLKIMNYNDKISIRAILNKKDFNSRESEIKECKKTLEIIKSKIFNWLDQTSDPYYFIFCPVWDFGAYFEFRGTEGDGSGYRRVKHSGLINIDLACDYAKYRITK